MAEEKVLKKVSAYYEAPVARRKSPVGMILVVILLVALAIYWLAIRG